MRLTAVDSPFAPFAVLGRVPELRGVFEGLDHAPEALLRVFRGETIGKTIVRLAGGA